MWGWLTAILTALLEFFWKKRKEPTTTIENAHTPKPMADANTAAYHEWLRHVRGDDKGSRD
jgi:hypothetical protein